MNKVYIMCGCPGSGKTFVANMLFDHLPILNPDDYMDSNNWTKEKSNEAWDALHEDIKIFCEAKATFVIDTVGATELKRRRLTQLIRQENPEVEIVCLFIETPKDICKQRNRQRDRTIDEKKLDNYYRHVMSKPPTKADGFDLVIPIDGDDYFGNNMLTWKTDEPWPEGWYH
jgi:predicted kinase